jgi:hypothetical protein
MTASVDQIAAVAERVLSAESWNRRVALIREIPESFGKMHHQAVYAAIAKTAYVSALAPDFAYVDWRDEYELAAIEKAYQNALDLTDGFTTVSSEALAHAITKSPDTVRIFRLMLGFTTQEFSASTVITAEQLGSKPVSNGVLKSMEGGKPTKTDSVRVIASVIDKAMRGELFAKRSGEVRSKLSKPDTIDGWITVRKYASERVPFPVFLHQRHYGGAFRQLLDATSGKRGGLLEQAVEEVFNQEAILFVRTGASNQATIATKFGLTVKPAPDFVVHDASGTLRAILECKQANDGGTARDKAARFGVLRGEAIRLGGIPVFAVLAGLGWRRTADTLGPVIRDTDGRVFTIQTLPAITTVEPFPSMRNQA